MANVIGLGAEKFVSGLINQLSASDSIDVENLYLRKNISEKNSCYCRNPKYVAYRLGNISRIFEIITWKFLNKSKNNILVLGDLPLFSESKQFVLCHQGLMFEKYSILTLCFWKFLLFKLIFKCFLKRDDVVLVQTSDMADKIRAHINKNANVRIIEIKSSSFDWPNFRRVSRRVHNYEMASVRLFYPAAPYPHKNHLALRNVKLDPNIKIFLTIDNHLLEGSSNNLEYVGRISREKVFDFYQEVDGLLFLSSCESLGMPILEAVKCNLPIVCPNLGYTAMLESADCFYFDLDDINSLNVAISEMKNKLHSGWWPNWDFETIFHDTNSLGLEEILMGN